MKSQYLIDEQYHYDDVFFRMVTISIARTLHSRVRWINKFENKKIRVLLPFFAGIPGSERFLLDAFVDDIPDKRVELDTTQKQRGVVTMKSVTSLDDQFSNPNQYISKSGKINNELREIWSRIKAIPVSIAYDLEIRLDNALEIDIVIGKLMNVLFNYRFTSIEYFGQKIDIFLKLPPDKGIDIPREIKMDGEITPKITFSLEVQTYYPIFLIDTDDCEICDNDDQIDWNFLGVERPTEDNDNCKGLKRVNWYNNLIDKKTKKEIIEEKLRDKMNDSDIIE